MNWFGSQELSETKPIPDDENRILDKLAKRVVRWKMAVPAIIFLESIKPLNYIGSQTMVFFEPIVQTLFNFLRSEEFATRAGEFGGYDLSVAGMVRFVS